MPISAMIADHPTSQEELLFPTEEVVLSRFHMLDGIDHDVLVLETSQGRTLTINAGPTGRFYVSIFLEKGECLFANTPEGPSETVRVSAGGDWTNFQHWETVDRATALTALEHFLKEESASPKVEWMHP